MLAGIAAVLIGTDLAAKDAALQNPAVTRAPGLRGVAQNAPYFHDGSARTLREVIDVYAGRVTPALSDAEKNAVVAYMQSL